MKVMESFGSTVRREVTCHLSGGVGISKKQDIGQGHPPKGGLSICPFEMSDRTKKTKDKSPKCPVQNFLLGTARSLTD